MGRGKQERLSEKDGMLQRLRQMTGFLPRLIAGLLLVFALGSAPALAQDLNALRASGAVGERFDGYAQARDASAADAVRSINAKRQQIYKQRAAEQGVSADQVGRIYAKQIMQDAPAGTYFLSETNQWVQK